MPPRKFEITVSCKGDPEPVKLTLSSNAHVGTLKKAALKKFVFSDDGFSVLLLNNEVLFEKQRLNNAGLENGTELVLDRYPGGGLQYIRSLFGASRNHSFSTKNPLWFASGEVIQIKCLDNVQQSFNLKFQSELVYVGETRTPDPTESVNSELVIRAAQINKHVKKCVVKLVGDMEGSCKGVNEKLSICEDKLEQLRDLFYLDSVNRCKMRIYSIIGPETTEGGMIESLRGIVGDKWKVMNKKSGRTDSSKIVYIVVIYNDNSPKISLDLVINPCDVKVGKNLYANFPTSCDFKNLYVEDHELKEDERKASNFSELCYKTACRKVALSRRIEEVLKAFTGEKGVEDQVAAIGDIIAAFKKDYSSASEESTVKQES